LGFWQEKGDFQKQLESIVGARWAKPFARKPDPNGLLGEALRNPLAFQDFRVCGTAITPDDCPGRCLREYNIKSTIHCRDSTLYDHNAAFAAPQHQIKVRRVLSLEGGRGVGSPSL
jgi:hypothetical protein